jgi:hypothetical protein
MKISSWKLPQLCAGLIENPQTFSNFTSYPQSQSSGFEPTARISGTENPSTSRETRKNQKKYEENNENGGENR